MSLFSHLRSSRNTLEYFFLAFLFVLEVFAYCKLIMDESSCYWQVFACADARQIVMF